jgi:MFS family permease
MLEGYILQKVLHGKWLGINVILWGITVACTAAVKNYHGLLACRILLGMFEAAMPPCLMLIIGEYSISFLSSSTGSFRLWLQECGIPNRKVLGDSAFGFVG